MAGYDPVVAVFEATTTNAVESIARYEAALGELQATFARVAEASGVLDERLAVAERGFQTAAVEANALSSELTGLEGRLGAAGANAKTLASGLSNIGKSAATVGAGLDESATAITEFAGRVDSVDEQLSTFNGRLALLGDGAVKLGGKFADAGAEILKSLASINSEIAATVAAMNEAAAATAAFAASQVKAAESTKTVQGAAASSSKTLKELGTSFALIGGALDLTDFAMLKVAGTFQSNMTRLQTEAGLTDEAITQFAGSMQNLSAKVLAIGDATGTAGTDISNALYEPISAGLKLSDALDTVKYSAEEAKISGAGLEDTTTALTAIMKDFGATVSSPEEGMADLNAIVGQGMMRFSDFDAAIKNWAPTAATFGVSLNSAGAALAYMTDRGESAQSAGTKLAQVMAMMVGQTTQAGKLMGALGLSESDVATSNDAMAGAMATAHVTTSQLADDLRKPDGLTVALNDLKGHLENAGLSADAANSVLVRAFGGGRQFKGLAELIQNTDQLQQKFDTISNDSNITHFEDQWQKVTGNFSQQWDTMIASVKNFGIAIGTNLLPAGAAILGFFSKIATAVGQNKDVIGALSTVFGILAVALPVGALVIFISKMGEMTKTVIGVTTNVAAMAAGFTYGLSHLDSFSGIVSTVLSSLLLLGDVTKVLGGPGGGIAKIGESFGNAMGSLRNFGSEIGNAEGAAAKVGKAVSGVSSFLTGPWGIAVGVAAVALGPLIDSFLHGSAAADDLTAAIGKDSGALGTNTQAWVTSNLQKNGALDAAGRLGIQTNVVTSAILGNKVALDMVNATLAQHSIHVNTADKSAGELGKSQIVLSGDAQKLKDAIGSLSGTVDTSSAAYKQQELAAAGVAAAQAKQTIAALQTDSSNDSLTQSSMQVTDALNATKAAASQLSDALNLLNGGNIDAEKANLSFKDSVDTLGKSIHGGTDALNDNTDSGRANIKAILDAASAAATHAEAVAKQTGHVEDGNKAFEADVGVLQGVMANLGLTKDQIDQVTKTWLQLPHNMNTNYTSNIGPQLSSLQQYASNLNALNGTDITTNVTTHYRSIKDQMSSATGGLITQKRATGGELHRDYGGPVSGPGTESSDSIPVWLSDREYVIRARSADQVGTGVLNALNAGDLDTVYRMLGQRSDVHSAQSSVDMSQLAGLLGGGNASQQQVMVVNITPQGSILAENDLRAMIQQTVLRYSNRNVGAGWTGAFT